MPNRTELNELYSAAHELKQVKAQLKNTLSNLRVVNATVARVCSERDALQAKLTEASLQHISDFGQLQAQEPVAKIHVNHINGESSAILFNRVTMHHGDPLYAAAGASPDQGEVVVTKTPDGQIVAVTRQDEEGRVLKVIAESAGAATVPMTQDRAEELAHRRCKRYRKIDDVPYQFDATTLMDFVRDVEKAGAAPVPEGLQLVTGDGNLAGSRVHFPQQEVHKAPADAAEPDDQIGPDQPDDQVFALVLTALGYPAGYGPDDAVAFAHFAGGVELASI